MSGARDTDPPTSHDAFESLPVTDMEELVLAAVVAAGRKGATQDELMILMPGWAMNTITPRIYPLLTKGRVYDLGEQRTAPRTKRRQRVVVAARFLEPWEKVAYKWSARVTRKQLLYALNNIIGAHDFNEDVGLAIEEARQLLGDSA